MGSYVPSTLQERQEMLESIGLSSIDQLFSHIPDELKLKGELNLPSGMSELEVSSAMKKIAAKNVVFGSIFRGAGAYDHYIPSIVKSVTGKEEFLTAYTPYQAEISQGILQSIFEYQTMICDLTGMDISNACVYDGAEASAEGVAMCRDRKRSKALVSATVNPYVLETIKTYCFGNEMKIEVIPEKDGLFIELDVFHGEYEGVLLAEVEFPTEEAANAYTAPDWFGEDVTYSTRYHNSTMSQGWQSDYCSLRSQ